MHDHDGHVFIGAGNIGIVVRQFSLFAYRCAIPFEAGEAALRHVSECTGMFARFSSDPEGLSGWMMIIMYFTQVEQEISIFMSGRGLIMQPGFPDQSRLPASRLHIPEGLAPLATRRDRDDNGRKRKYCTVYKTSTQVKNIKQDYQTGWRQASGRITYCKFATFVTTALCIGHFQLNTVISLDK